MKRFSIAMLMMACLPVVALSLNHSKELREWQFRLDADSTWQQVCLPHSCNAIDGQSAHYYRGDTHYRRTISINAVGEGHSYELLLKSAAQRASISVNGREVSVHKGGYTPFSIDITPFVHQGDNELTISCNNEMDLTMAPVSSDFNKNNGLHDKVFLLEHEAVYADTHTMGYRGMHVVQKSVDSRKASIEVQAQLVSNMNAKTDVELRTWLTDASGMTVAEESRTVSLTPNGKSLCATTLDIDRPHLWQGTDDPYLYTAHVQVVHRGHVVEECSARTGLRTVGLDAEKGFMLNGKPYSLRGFSYHQDCYGRASAVTHADIDRDFRIIAQLGCNMLRLAHYPHNEYTFDLCDELGIVVQTEIPWVNECGGNKAAYSQEEYEENLVSQFAEMIVGHYNHPSVAFWGMWNELGGSHARRPQGDLDAKLLLKVTDRLYDLGKHQLDPTRLYGFADMGYGMDIKELSIGRNYDYWGCNKYYGWYSDPESPDNAQRMAKFIDEVRDRGGIVAITEYGAGNSPYCHSDNPEKTTGPATGGARHDEEWANLLHEHHVRLIMQRPWLVFTSSWVLFDFAVADRREGYVTTADGVTLAEDHDKLYTNDKGLVSRDRQTLKDVFYLYKAWWNPEPMVYITSRRHTERTSDQIIIKAYSNASSMKLMQNGKQVGELNRCPDPSGIIWTFAPVRFQTTADTFTIEATMADGTKTYDTVCFEKK